MPDSPTAAIPRLSVVMPVRNAGAHLDAAIESILRQTFADFELVLLDDASEDGSCDRLGDWARRDPRIRLFRNEASLGLAGSSHFVVERAHAPLVARMDADDTSRPERLDRQLAIMDAEPETVLVGTLWEGIDDEGRVIRRCDRSRLLERGAIPPIAHGSVMFRRDAWLVTGGYRPKCEYWEDIDLFYRLSRLGAIKIIPEPLYRYRFHSRNSRITVDLRRLEQATERLVRCAAEMEAGRSYEPLLEGPPSDVSRPARLYAYASHISSAVMGGSRPNLAAILAHPFVPLCTQAVKVYGEAIVGTVSPAMARFMMNQAAKLRDHFARRRLRPDEAITWQFER